MGAVEIQEDVAASVPSLVTEVPGPKARALLAADAEVTSPSLPRAYGFVPARGSGVAIEDVDGNVFLDFNAGIAVCATGHCHPRVVEAVTRQASTLLHYSASDFYLPIYAELCRKLAEVVPFAGARSFLTNSGTEAVEAALKLARHHTGRQNVIAFLGAFHGRSYGSVSITASKAKYRSRFGPLLPGVIHAPYADTFDLGSDEEVAAPGYIEKVIFQRLAAPEDVAAIIVEPVLGEGGYVVPPREWMQSLRDLCDAHGILLIADEVQSGVGRTGKMWAIEHFGVEPDIVVSAKGLASGLPLGAMIARPELMTWGKGTHGSTSGGNPLSCAAGLATLELVVGGLAANAAKVGSVLIEKLREVERRTPEIREVRGLGLMIGVELQTAELADQVELACVSRGLLTLRAGDRTIRISPPLILTEEQALVGARIFAQACDEVLGSRT
ncbi:MAG: aminotransferase class III-fold pyridoxal phosphate-dependent enzyme [Gaiellaceae bacterium]